VWSENNLPDPVVTSGNDGIHPGNNHPGIRCGPSDSEADCRATSDSYHYKDKAIDLRSNDMDPQNRDVVVSQLKNKLGDAYRIAVHDKGKENEHIHIEYRGQ
jgi:hypothetical protein